VLALQRIALCGLVWVIVCWIFSIATITLAGFSYPHKSNQNLIGALSLIWMSAYLGVALCTAFWVYRAHGAVCSLREIEPRIASSTVALLAFGTIALLGFPIYYVMDFLVVRSDSPDKATMKWNSPWSKSGQVNTLTFLAVIPSGCLIVWLTLKVDQDLLAIIFLTSVVALNFACIQGAFLVFQVNRRIAQQVNARNRLTNLGSPHSGRD
jgi:hypothetical protein